MTNRAEAFATRTPTAADLPTILRLTRHNRSLLAALEPDFWRKSANADALHEAFLTYQIANETIIKRVLEDNGRVIGYAVCFSHPSGFYVVDDVSLAADADWQTAGTLLLRSIAERPAIMTAPHGDSARVAAAHAIGLTHIGTVRSLRFDQEPPLDLGPARAPVAVPKNLAAPPLQAPPLHVWLPAMTPESITVIGDSRGGYAVVSSPIAAPPIYDPGGHPCVVDRVIGYDRQALLIDALSFAAQRGDVGVILIVAEDDAELSAIADRLGARHPVDVFRWPVHPLSREARPD